MGPTVLILLKQLQRDITVSDLISIENKALGIMLTPLSRDRKSALFLTPPPPTPGADSNQCSIAS